MNASNLTVERLPNRGAYLTGDLADLQAFRARIFAKIRHDLRLINEHTIDGVAQPGYPRIELHPSTADRVLAQIDGDTIDVPSEIIATITPGTFFMLGARGSVSSLPGGLGIRFGIKGCSKINRIEVELDRASDTYNVRFLYQRGASEKQRSAHEGIYSDAIHDLIERETGLVTRMPRVTMVRR